jgi:hypothetical protein
VAVGGARIGCARVGELARLVISPSRARPDRHGEQLALGLRQGPGVTPGRGQHVERVVEHRVVAQPPVAGAGHAKALLQPSEPGLRSVERDDLPVQDQAVVLLGGQGRGDLGEGPG